LPEDVRQDFEEARTVLDLSPRGAAALLRLSIQKLCKHLGESGKDINNDIGSLVAKGLDARVQKMLDTVRVIGNESVHPGQIDMKDNREVAAALFQLVNRIAYDLITHPKEVDALYGTLPPSKLDGIAKRDGRKTESAFAESGCTPEVAANKRFATSTAARDESASLKTVRFSHNPI
jgi:uncharacterized protein DUF4145